MRASDLLGAELVDDRGVSLGRVRDIRLVRDGPIAGTFGAAFRIQGLVAGPRSLGSRLGFERSTMRGPLPLKALFRWLHRGSHFVEWERVQSIEADWIRIRPGEATRR
jgi:hypothetical protein